VENKKPISGHTKTLKVSF